MSYFSISIFFLHFFLVKSHNHLPQSLLVPALYVFGDSQVDCGVNNHLNTTANGFYEPYGIDFPIGSTGRFSNGRTIADFLDHLLGLKTTIPYLTKMESERILTTGLNYASGSSGILAETGRHLGENWCLKKQVSMFKDTCSESLAKRFNGTLSLYLSQSVFIVLSGMSDYSDNYLQYQSYNTSRIYNYQDFGSLLITKLGEQLEELYELGARKIVVFEIGPIGCYPAALKLSKVQNKCNDDINYMVSVFNEKLKRKVEELNSKLNNATIGIAKTFSLIVNMIKNPSTYGFEDVRNSCCVVRHNDEGLCNPDENPCERRNELLFWDDHHLSEAANLIIAEESFKDDQCFPKNIYEATTSSGQSTQSEVSVLFLLQIVVAGHLYFVQNLHKFLSN